MDTLPPESYGEQPKRILTAKLYPQPHKSHLRDRRPQSIESPSRSVRKAFKGITQCVNHNLDLHIETKGWPDFRSDKGDPDEAYAHLNGSEHAADYGVLVTTSLDTVIHEVPALLATRHRLAHVFVVSLGDTSVRDINHAKDVLDTMPVAATRQSDSAVYSSGFKEEESSLQFLKPSEQGMLSIHSFKKICRDHTVVRDAIALVAALKYEDFHRSDIDEDGKTLNKKPYEGWYRWSFEKQDPSEDWKPDGWELD